MTVRAADPRFSSLIRTMAGVLTGDDRGLRRALLVLAVASTFCGALAVARVGLTGRRALLFLGWDLILAWVPLLISVAIACRRAPGRHSSRFWTFGLGAVWLAFYPNAPYRVTGLIHRRARRLDWHLSDAMMVLAFARPGLCIAF